MRYFFLLLSCFLLSCGNTYYIVRHAEKQMAEPGTDKMIAADPPLTQDGLTRAYELRELLRTKSIRYIFSTNFKRTVATVQPINELRGDTHIDFYSSSKDSIDAFISRLRTIRKGNVLVVGHSNTIDDLANKLCGKTVVPGDLDEKEYDNLFVIKRKGNRFSFTNKKFGKLSN